MDYIRWLIEKVCIFLHLIKVVIIWILFFCLLFSCTERKRLNPLDPHNEHTQGKPTGLRVISEKHDVTLMWDNIGLESLAGYNIYRRDYSSPVFQKLDSVSPDHALYADEDLPYYHLYSYQISVFTDTGYETPPSDSVCIMPGPHNFWVIDYTEGHFIKLTYDGSHRILLSYDVIWPVAIALDTTLKAVYVIDNILGEIYRFRNDGTFIWRSSGLSWPVDLEVNPINHVIWVYDSLATRVVCFDSSGEWLGETTNFGKIADMHCTGLEGGCWILDVELGEIVYLSHPGDRRESIIDGFENLRSISCPYEQNWFWVADSTQIFKIWPDGQRHLLIRTGKIIRDMVLHPTGTFGWIITEADENGNSELIKISAAGDILTRIDGFRYARTIGLDDTEGGCIVMDTGNSRVVRLLSDGQIIGVYNTISGPWDVAVE